MSIHSRCFSVLAGKAWEVAIGKRPRIDRLSTLNILNTYFSLQSNIKNYFDFLTALLYSGHDIYSMDFLNIVVLYVLGFTICLLLYLFADSNFLKRGPIGKLRKLSWKVGLVAKFI